MQCRGGGGACAHRRGNQYDMAAAEQQCMQARSTNAALPICGRAGRRVYTATALRRCSNGICLCAGVASSMQCRGSGGACAHRRGNQYAMAAAGQQRIRVRSTNEREAHTVPEGMGVGSNACGRAAQTSARRTPCRRAWAWAATHAGAWHKRRPSHMRWARAARIYCHCLAAVFQRHFACVPVCPPPCSAAVAAGHAPMHRAISMTWPRQGSNVCGCAAQTPPYPCATG